MSNVLRLAIVDPNDSKRESLKSMLLGMDMIWLEAECSRYEFFSDVVAQTDPEIGLVAIDANVEKGLELVAELSETSANCAVLVVSASNDGNLILRAMRAGAKEFLTAVEELLKAKYPSTTFTHFDTTINLADTPEKYAEMAESCDAFILGSGD